MLDRVTFTGADESVDVRDLVAISKRCPFVEWGILFSPQRIGTPRYPGSEWLSELVWAARRGSLQLSAHLCGRYQRDALAAQWTWQSVVREAAYFFNRVQINCGANPEPAVGEMLRHWPMDQRVILQCSSRNHHWIKGAAADGHKFDVLFDNSGGRGELPTEWPTVFDRVFCGQAGGLGPDNVYDEMDAMERASGGRPFWIDMEGRIRSDEGRRFDLDKVNTVIARVSSLFKRPAARTI